MICSKGRATTANLRERPACPCWKLRKKSLTGVAAVVTRYFGGIKLGAGGLVRAYTNSIVHAVEEAGLARRVEMAVFALSALRAKPDAL